MQIRKDVLAAALGLATLVSADLGQPGAARSIQLLVAPQDLPILKWLQINPSKSL
jgi:hypothetical protein